MKTLAIIAEYNPFHNGHVYQINKAKELTGADNVIAIMSGNFMQRGEASYWDKYTRAKMAGAFVDLVLELPAVYATGSAYDFATGAVTILDKLNTVDYLCFGAEYDDLETLQTIAEILVKEPEKYQMYLKDTLSSGLSFPVAREKAITLYILENCAINLSKEILQNILSEPNNILAIEYLCALLRINSKIKPILIKRTIANYHDDSLANSIASAKAIRSSIHESGTYSDCMNHVPESTYKLIQDTHNITSPVYTADLSALIQGARLQAEPNNICDFDQELVDRLNKLPISMSYDDLTAALSTKNRTNTRIARALIHYLLGYTTKDRDLFKENGYAFYANLLAFRKNKSALIKQINEHGRIKIITKKADYKAYLPEDHLHEALRMWDIDCKATTLYNSLVYNRYKNALPNDYQQSPIIL